MVNLKTLFNPNLIIENDNLKLAINGQFMKYRFIKCFLFSSLKLFNYLLKEPAAYIILNTIDGKFYIGSSSNIYSRILQHRCELNGNKHQSLELQKSFNITNKYMFHISVIFTKSKEESLDIEQYLLDNFYTDVNCCNSHPNSRSSTGSKHSLETKEKISNIVKGRVVSNETRAKLSKINKGKKLTIEQRLKLSIKAKERPVDYERLKRMSDGNIGRKHHEDTLYKKSLSAINRKPVKINDEIYHSIAWAAKQLGISMATIYGRVKSKSPRFNNYTVLEQKNV